MFGLGLTEMLIFGLMALMMIGVPLVVILVVLGTQKRQNDSNPPDDRSSTSGLPRPKSEREED